jgi:hypothetical protein
MDEYGLRPAEMAQATRAYNTAYQALLNDMQVNPNNYPEDIRRQFQQYKGFTNRDAFLARTNWLNANNDISKVLFRDLRTSG